MSCLSLCRGRANPSGALLKNVEASELGVQLDAPQPLVGSRTRGGGSHSTVRNAAVTSCSSAFYMRNWKVEAVRGGGGGASSRRVALADDALRKASAKRRLS